MEKQKFEDGWKGAFQNAEVSPSENVWTNIELELEKEESTGIRRKLLFYKMVAAASVIFAMAVAGAGVYMYQVTGAQFASSKQNQVVNPPQITEENKTANGNASANDNNLSAPDNMAANMNAIRSDEKKSAEIASSEDHTFSASKKSALGVIGHEASHKESSGDVPVSAAVESVHHNDHERVVGLTISQHSLPSLVNLPEPAFRIPEAEEKVAEDPVVAMMAALQQREKELSAASEEEKSKKKKGDDLWTSVGMAAGSFSSSNPTPGLPMAARDASPGSALANSNNTGAIKETKASGVSYSMGLNLGKRISRRFLVLGGVNYMAQVSNYTSQTAVTGTSYTSFRPEALTDANATNSGDFALSDSRIVTTTPHKVYNNMRYLSVPMQAGYVVFDSKIGVQLNAGFSTDLFLNYTKSAGGQTEDGQEFKKLNVARDDQSSPYRPVNFSGLLGTEFIYKFGERYRLSLNPGLRYPLNSIYKPEVGIQAAPLTFDVGLRFRYIFQ